MKSYYYYYKILAIILLITASILIIFAPCLAKYVSIETMENENTNVYPITFSIPEEKIVDSVPEKTKVMSDLIPGKTETYIYHTEDDYYKEYQKSIFATTIKKGGWDCMRHYEILANGAIPYFPNLEECPENTLALFPKELVIQGNALYLEIKDKQIKDIPTEKRNECKKLAEKLLQYTKDNLTTSQVAKYILDKSGHSDASQILYLSGATYPDYLRCVTLHGFKKLYGEKCHDYPKIPHIYADNTIKYNTLYGKGYSYTNLLDPLLHNNSLNDTVEEDIKNKKYDIVIYGSYHRGMPHFDLVKKHYPPNKIILLCGEDYVNPNYNDWHSSDHNKLGADGYHVFVREM
uniref:Uncharacterized protein n=1 Tax=viral metagenome TaxID=1070528 RepID=A0A6C0DS67_9ZZZZ